MKQLKKISLVYTLQVVAVILIFGFAGVSTVADPKTMLQQDKHPLPGIAGDSLLTGNIIENTGNR